MKNPIVNYFPKRLTLQSRCPAWHIFLRKNHERCCRQPLMFGRRLDGCHQRGRSLSAQWEQQQLVTPVNGLRLQHSEQRHVGLPPAL